MADVIEDLDAVNEKAADWIIHTTPKDAADAEAMKRVVGLHNQLDQLLARLQLADLQHANAALAGVVAKQGAQLDAISVEIGKVANDITLVQTVISCVAQAVAAAAQIVAVVGAAASSGADPEGH